MPEPHVWDRTKNEMEIITLAPGSKFNYQFHFRIYVAFGNIKLVDGEPIFPILDNLVGKVERILAAMEAESKRLGILK
jgi:hypothetical protein